MNQSTEYGRFQFITISTFKVQNIEMALKLTSSIEDIEMWYLKTLKRLEKIQTWRNLNSLSVKFKENKAPWKKERTRIINYAWGFWNEKQESHCKASR